MFWIAVGLVIAGIMGGNAPHAAASSAATSKDVKEDGAASAATDATASAPLGVAAPDTVVIADFDNGSDRASYGMGWHAGDDKERGGNSTISQRLIEGGAQIRAARSKSAARSAPPCSIPLSGTSFLPNGTEGRVGQAGLMDYSRKQTLSFYARGDGQTYTVVVMGPALDGNSADVPFTAGADWQEVTSTAGNLSGVDMKRVKLISIGSTTPGPFRFQIDDVRLD